jgi:hypothetical protein
VSTGSSRCRKQWTPLSFDLSRHELILFATTKAIRIGTHCQPWLILLESLRKQLPTTYEKQQTQKIDRTAPNIPLPARTILSQQTMSKAQSPAVSSPKR